MTCACDLGALNVGHTDYFAIVVPEGLLAVALISTVNDGVVAAWLSKEARGRDFVPNMELAWEFLRSVFNANVTFRPVTPFQYRKFLAELKPRAYTPTGRMRIITRERGYVPPSFAPQPTTFVPKQCRAGSCRLPGRPPKVPRVQVPPPPPPPELVEAAFPPDVFEPPEGVFDPPMIVMAPPPRPIMPPMPPPPREVLLVPPPPPPAFMPPPEPMIYQRKAPPSFPFFNPDDLPQTPPLERRSSTRKKRR